jgi:hypothetical protein
MRRSVRVKTVQRLPRPLSDGQVEALIAQLWCERDWALVLMMLEGGLRPGETLGLRLDDIDYGRRRVVVRHREDHPRGVRSKSRTERVVDLHEGAPLTALSGYVMGERPREADTALVFLVGGNTRRRCEPLGTPRWLACSPAPPRVQGSVRRGSPRTRCVTRTPPACGNEGCGS